MKMIRFGCWALIASVLATGAQSGPWSVTDIDGAQPVADATVTFEPGGGVHVDTGCNMLRMSGRIDGATLTIVGPVAATRMACPGGLADQETALETLFQGDVALSFDPFADVLILQAGGVTARLVASHATGDDASERGPAPDPWPTHGGRDKPAGSPPYLGVYGLAQDMPIRAEPQDNAEVVVGVPSGTVLRNAGCADGWCVVETLGGNVSGWALPDNLEPAADALRAGQKIFDATGRLTCSTSADAALSGCLFGVARGADGAATVVVQRHDGMQRALFFQQGGYVSTDASQAGGGFDTAASRSGELTTVQIDGETYEIPDVLLFGG